MQLFFLNELSINSIILDQLFMNLIIAAGIVGSWPVAIAADELIHQLFVCPEPKAIDSDQL